MQTYGLFVVDYEQVMPFFKAEEIGIVDDELAEQFEDTRRDQQFCIFGTFHSYKYDN